MARGMFLDNPHYRENVRLLKELHQLTVQNKTDTEEAEAVLDQMDQYWYKLSPKEMERVGILSADLQMLEGKEVFRQVPPIERSREWLEPKLRNARNHRDWAGVLELLRNGPDFLLPDQIALLRGQSYAGLGHKDIALLFYEHAARLNPQVSYYPVLVMHTLVQLERMEEAVTYAEKFIADENAHPLQLLHAADVLFLSARSTPKQEARDVFERVLVVLDRALDKQIPIPQIEQLQSFAMPAYLLKGICHESLGQADAALEAYNKVIEIDPDAEGAYTARGILLSGTNPEAAATDFEQAVSRNTRSISPYLFLAHRALIHKDYQRCLQICQQALQLTQRPNIIARILTWIAIAQYGLGRPSEAIQHLFETALTYDPLNDEIRYNYQLFKRYPHAASLNTDESWHIVLPSREEARSEVAEIVHPALVAA